MRIAQQIDDWRTVVLMKAFYVLIAAVAAFFLVESEGMAGDEGQFPQVVAITMLVLVVVAASLNFRATRRARRLDSDNGSAETKVAASTRLKVTPEMRRVGTILGAGCIFAAVAETVGFLIGVGVVVCGTSVLLRYSRQAAVYAAVTGVAIALLFQFLFSLGTGITFPLLPR